MIGILLPIKPKWCALMMNGIKKIEVRKENVGKAVQKLIDKYGFADIYVYCTKGKPNLWLPYEYNCFELDEASQPYLSDEPILDIDTKMNGKVVAKFTLNKAEEIRYFDELQIPDGYEDYDGNWVDTSEYAKDIHWVSNGQLEQMRLSYDELHKYLGSKNGYAWHISNLEIFDKPKELIEFYRVCNKCPFKNSQVCFDHCGEDICKITKAPFSWCYVEVER